MRIRDSRGKPQALVTYSCASVLTIITLPDAHYNVHPMASSGLSRRRVNASISSSENVIAELNGHAPSSSNNSPIGHAGSAFAGGSKVGFDPRDLERDEEEAKVGGKMPHLTIMEEVLLLGLKDKQVRARRGGGCPDIHAVCTTTVHSLILCSGRSFLLYSSAFRDIRAMANTVFIADTHYRAICHSGTTTYRTRCEAASLSS